MSSVRREALRSAPDARVYLYELDTSVVSGPTYTWTPGPFGSRNAIPSPYVGWTKAGTDVGSLAEASVYPAFQLLPGGTAYIPTFAAITSGTSRHISPRMLAVPGLKYAFTVLTLPYRCEAKARILFVDSAGATLKVTTATTGAGLTSLPASATTEDAWQRIFVEGVAPTSPLPDGIVRVMGVVVLDALPGGWTQSLYLHARPYLGLRGADGSMLWTPGDAKSAADGKVKFNGVTYEAVPVQIEGIMRTPRGAQPRVTVSLPNINGFASQLLAAHNNLLGCKITRRTTFKRFLDGMQDGGDANATFDTQVWYIDRVALISPEVVQLEAVAATDLQGVYLPVRTVLRDTCQHTYRYWNATTASYVPGTCPYSGVGAWDATGAATDAAHDNCGRRLSDCILRFPSGVLPTRAFPGVGRLRS